MYRCQYCHELYELEDYTDESEAATNCCPDCYYTGNMFSVEEDTEETDYSVYDQDEEDDLDDSYDDIEVSDEVFNE